MHHRPLLVLLRKVAGGFTIAYVPHGPDIGRSYRNGDFLVQLGREIEKHLDVKPVFIRYDLPWGVKSSGQVSFAFGPELVKAVSDIQPPDTVVVSLREPEDEILKRMKPKTRYNIRLSGKKGVVINRGGKELLSAWYDLYRETAERDRITIHSKSYYESVFDIAELSKSGAPEVILFTAVFSDELLAGIIVLIYGSRATYLYGASSGNKRNLMPNYALQWEAMKYAKEQGCEEYDLFGIPPDDDPSHPMHGLYRFKTGFGGEVIRMPGCWDLPLKPLMYRVYRTAEKARKWYYKRFRKKR